MRAAAGGLMLACAGLLAWGCGGGSVTSGADGLSGSVVLDGAPEAAAVSEYAAEEFVRFHPDVRVQVDRSGDVKGVARLCRGEVDVVHAVRAPRPCPPGSGGRVARLRAVRVAVDALAVIAHPARPRPGCLRPADVRRLVAGAQAPGGALRAGPLPRVIGADRARTYPALATGRDRRRAFPPDDAAIGAAVARQPGAIGFVGAGWLAAHGEAVRVVPIAEPGGCVRPTTSSIRAGRYRSLTRPVLLVFRDDVVRSADAHALLRFAVSGDAAAVESALLVASGADELRRAVQIVG